MGDPDDVFTLLGLLRNERPMSQVLVNNFELDDQNFEFKFDN